jgi:hypothetical protein
VPTDLQAEAMIPPPVLTSDVEAIIVSSAAKAREHYGMLKR